jgi:Ser/Thr protein kinase RdoA (MazF antagonist)
MNDDAGGGLRGLRAEPSPELVDAVRDAYGLDVVLDPVRRLGGSSSLNLLARRGDRRCALRVYRPYVSAERLLAINAARTALAASGIPCSEVLPTREGRPCSPSRIASSSWRPMSSTMPTWTRWSV